MEVLKSQKHLASIKFGSVLAKALVFLDVHHQIASANVFHDKVQTSVGLEARVKSRQEGMALLACNLIDSLFRPRTKLNDSCVSAVAPLGGR